MSVRANLIQTLINRFHYDSYLEIGCGSDATFNVIYCDHKTGVDPVSGGNVRMTSDDYFASLSPCVRFSIVFIDGLHEYHQVLRDILGSLSHLEDGGVVIIHDCLPVTEDNQLPVNEFTEKFGERPPGVNPSRQWNGDVWKAIAKLKTWQFPDLCVLDLDWGLGIVKARQNQTRIHDGEIMSLEWDDFKRLKPQFSLVNNIEDVIKFSEKEI